MKQFHILCLIILFSFRLYSFGQESIVSFWAVDDVNNPNYEFVYRPYPLLMSHGYNSNDEGIKKMTKLLNSKAFNGYSRHEVANRLFTPEETVDLHANQYSFIHTFNWGDRPNFNSDKLNVNTFNHAEWVASTFDRDNTDYEVHLSSGTINHQAPGKNNPNPRKTLEERVVDVYDAYTIPDQDQQKPLITYLAHSAGAGLIGHYYLTKNVQNNVIRRYISLGAPHLGSPLGEFYFQYMSDPVFRATRDRNGGSGFRDFGRSLNISRGNFIFALNGIMEDLQFESPNNFIGSMRSKPIPNNVEYLFNIYRSSENFLHDATRWSVGWRNFNNQMYKVFEGGDGIVSAFSQSGQHSADEPSIYGNGSVKPVLLGRWGDAKKKERAFHTAEYKHEKPILLSLNGIPFDWNSWPDKPINEFPYYSHFYDTEQSFSKYLPEKSTIAGKEVTHSDSPGLDFEILIENNGHYLLVDTIFRNYNTLETEWRKNVQLIKENNSKAVIIDSNKSYLQIMAITGCKDSGHESALLGNEYWPHLLNIAYSVGDEVVPVVFVHPDKKPVKKLQKSYKILKQGKQGVTV